MKQITYTLLFVFMMAGCTPMGKESYLKKFDVFISDVADNHKAWDEGDWLKKTERFDKLSGEWYDKFDTELTWQEKLKVKGLEAKFHYYRTLDQSSAFLKDIDKEINGLLESLNVNEIKEQVRYYIDNDMTTDLELLYDEALEVGGETMEAVTKIFEELQVDTEALQ